MFRQQRAPQNNTVDLGSIVIVEVQHLKSTIEGQPANVPKILKNKKKKNKQDQKNDSAANDNAEPEIDNATANDDKRPDDFPEELKVSAKYNFTDQTLILGISDRHFQWSLVSLVGTYKFSNKKIAEADFIDITGNDFIYNLSTSDDPMKSKTFKLNVGNIDRHIFMKTFSILVSFIFIEDPDWKRYHCEYSFDVPFFQQETRLRFKFLGHYHADKRIVNLYNHKFKRHEDLSAADLLLLQEIDQYQRTDIRERNAGNSSQMIKYALNIEDLSSQDELKDFTLRDVFLEGLMNNYSFVAKESKLPPQFEEMSICLVPMEKYQEGRINFEDDCIFAQVDKVEGGRIHFEKTQKMLKLATPYFVRFIPNRITYRACFQALDSIRMLLLHRFFDDFEDVPMNSSRDNGAKVDNFQWYNQQIGTNEEQMTAIKNIVNCTAYPFPYVVFGPPGTGKTSCIVECIAQILKTKPKSRIMVTAQSNSACDEVGVRLLKYISRNKIFRYYSPSLLNPKSGDTSSVLRETSNLRSKRNDYPTKEEFSHFNVVIVTLMSCSRLVQLEGMEMNRNFDFIFVDECAAAMEPEAFVPIIGLGAAEQEITTNLVLFGDHKQLGPVINSDIASRMGLSVSFMERIMSKRRYRMNPIDKSFDSNYVTQLLDNYRSHPAILQFSNVLFYESQLRAKIQEPEKSFGTKWNFLVNKLFPLLFHCVKTPSKILKGGTSSYNEGELDKVKFYVDLLLNVGIDGVKVKEEDIGIVSPYKAQLSKLREKLRHARNVEIGTAEYYQGREKKIIIISTVKSRDNVGFLKSEKRLNVCITRAKSLLILVGNADTLQKNSMWNSFMHFCKANDGVCGEPFVLKRLTDDEQRIMDELNTVFEQLSVDEEADTTLAIEKSEALQKIEDRMKKLQELMKGF